MHLQTDGHTVVAPDLPIDDDGADASSWAKTAVVAIDSCIGPDDPDVVVVAHSISGLCLPLIAECRTVSRMVFLSALIPTPGQPFADCVAEDPDILPFSAQVAKVGTEIGFGWEALHRAFYHDCPEHLARRAFEELRAQSITPFIEPSPLRRWPATPTTVIVMNQDRVVAPHWTRSMARRLPAADLVELDGGHSPFYADPETLANTLVQISRNTRRHSHPVDGR
jgi:pimeloyl-ACP methyl ester carboxylesterase